MKKWLLGAAALAMFAAVPTVNALAGELTVVNNTEFRMIRVYARNNANNELWSKNLKNEPLFPGERRTFYFNTRGACGDWNVEVDRAPNHMTKSWGASVCGGAIWYIDYSNLDNADNMND